VTRILLTRPEPGNSRTSVRLCELGFQVVSLPLTKIIGLNRDVKIEPHEVIIATSANAFLNVGSGVNRTALTLVVGQATRKAALAQGFTFVHLLGRTVLELTQNLHHFITKHTKITYLSGVVRTPYLEEFLSREAYHFHVVELYDTKIIEYDSDVIADLIAAPIDCVVLTSTLSVTALLGISALIGVTALEQNARAPWLNNALYFCFSTRIAQMLKHDHYIISHNPDETALITHINEYFKNS
jgi:uroporphyrinogen-III synthase